MFYLASFSEEDNSHSISIIARPGACEEKINVSDLLRKFPNTVSLSIFPGQQIDLGDFIEDLKTNTTLKSLYYNRIGYVEIIALINSLKTNTTLTTFTVDPRIINKQVVNALAMALRVNKTLITLDLRYRAIDNAEKMVLKTIPLFNDNLQDIYIHPDINIINLQDRKELRESYQKAVVIFYALSDPEVEKSFKLFLQIYQLEANWGDDFFEDNPNLLQPWKRFLATRRVPLPDELLLTIAARTEGIDPMTLAEYLHLH